MSQTIYTPEQLAIEIHRIRARKSYYKSAVKFWRLATFGLSGIVLLLVAALAFGAGDDRDQAFEVDASIDCLECEQQWTDEKPEPTETSFQQTAATPAFILASVHMANGNSCSGTVIGDDEHSQALIVSCSHCVAGNIGASCWWHLPTGKPFRAELIAYDRSIDVSVFRVDRADVIAVTKIVSPGGWSTASPVSACGYPQGAGPNLKTVFYDGDVTINKNRMPRWSYSVTTGTFEPGDSGGGVFFEGMLSGVITHKSGSTLYATPQPDVFRYVSEVAADALPGVPVAGNCPGGYCPPRRRPRQKYDWGDERAPSPPPFTPRPNVPINPPATPEDRIRDRDRDASIADILKRLALLEAGKSDGVNAGQLDVKLTAIGGRIDLTNQQVAEIRDRLDRLDVSIEERFASIPAGEIPPEIIAAVEALKIEFAELESRPPPDVPTAADILDQLPKIPVRVIDEKGKIVDSETYKLGEPITLFGRYRSRKK